MCKNRHFFETASFSQTDVHRQPSKKDEREGNLQLRIRFLSRNSLMIVDEIGYLPLTKAGNLRIVFRLEQGEARDVDLVDYH